MAVLSLTNAHLAFGHVPLLDGANFSLETGDRVGLIGRNGTGKSSMLKVLAGIEKLDDGLLQLEKGLTSVYVPQEPELRPEASIFDVVSEGVAEAKSLRERYEIHHKVQFKDAALVAAAMLGRRIGYGREALTPANLGYTMIGASLLWVGWMGFNGGSAGAADGRAGGVRARRFGRDRGDRTDYGTDD